MQAFGLFGAPGEITAYFLVGRPAGRAYNARSNSLPANLSNFGVQIKFSRHTQTKKPAIGGFFCLVRLERFELPTARFVAEYSIQLSYRRVFCEGRHYQGLA